MNQTMINIAIWVIVIFIIYIKRDLIIANIKKRLKQERELGTIRDEAYFKEKKIIAEEEGREQARNKYF